MRGLPVSGTLGSGLSFNCNNVTYLARSSASGTLGSGLSFNCNNVTSLARSSATLNRYALNRKQLSVIPFEERPGPSISSSSKPEITHCSRNANGAAHGLAVYCRATECNLVFNDAISWIIRNVVTKDFNHI